MTEQIAQAIEDSLVSRARLALSEKDRDVFYVSPVEEPAVALIFSSAGWQRVEKKDELTPGGISIQYLKPKTK
ncbi:MAG: hypothetical protein WAV41_01185 [Microgenomates group bacterium]